MPAQLKTVMEGQYVHFFGRQIGGDIAKLRVQTCVKGTSYLQLMSSFALLQEYGVGLNKKHCHELIHLAYEAGLVEDRRRSLEFLVRHLLGRSLPKHQRASMWHLNLQHTHYEYAALDAHAHAPLGVQLWQLANERDVQVGDRVRPLLRF